MPNKRSNNTKNKAATAAVKPYALARLKVVAISFWRKNVWHKIIIILAVVLFTVVSSMYGIAQWYIIGQHNTPLNLGATFIPNYARYLGVDPKETLSAVIHELKVDRLRLVSYWSDIEKTPGQYDFTDLDWQFRMAEEANVRVSLAIGLRQPRWPECHMPGWAGRKPMAEWSKDLKVFMQKVIERYKTSPVLDSYQLENEFFLTVFGICPDFTRDRLIDEAKFVKSLDPNRKLIITRSNNGLGFPINQPQPDEFGVSVYKRVWDKTVTKRYFEYPLPAWFYGFLAGGGKILTGKDLIIHELQAESWTPEGYNIKDAPIPELYKSLNPERLKDRFTYGKATGMKTIDVWGVEWWYQMKELRNSPELWNTAKEEFQRSR